MLIIQKDQMDPSNKRTSIELEQRGRLPHNKCLKVYQDCRKIVVGLPDETLHPAQELLDSSYPPSAYYGGQAFTKEEVSRPKLTCTISGFKRECSQERPTPSKLIREDRTMSMADSPTTVHAVGEEVASSDTPQGNLAREPVTQTPSESLGGKRSPISFRIQRKRPRSTQDFYVTPRQRDRLSLGQTCSLAYSMPLPWQRSPNPSTSHQQNGAPSLQFSPSNDSSILLQAPANSRHLIRQPYKKEKIRHVLPPLNQSPKNSQELLQSIHDSPMPLPKLPIQNNLQLEYRYNSKPLQSPVIYTPPSSRSLFDNLSTPRPSCSDTPTPDRSQTYLSQMKQSQTYPSPPFLSRWNKPQEPMIGGKQLVGDSMLLRFTTVVTGQRPTTDDDNNRRIGLCISGQSLSQLYSRLTHQLLTKPENSFAKNLLLMCGTNDILRGHDLSTMSSFIIKIVEVLRNQNCLVTVLTLPPIPKCVNIIDKCKLKDYNKILKTAVCREGVKIADIHNLFISPANGKPDLTLFEKVMGRGRPDLIHWNRAGILKLNNFLRQNRFL